MNPYLSHVLTALLLLLAISTPVAADSISGRIVGVSDGDTVTLLDSAKTPHKVRLIGIDAPEKSQPFGTRSKQSLSSLVFGKQVVIEFYKKDRYGRLIAKIATPNTPDVNLEQVKRGMAWHYKDYQREQSPIDRKAYANAEEEARAYRRGLWSDTDPVAPWAFRKARRAGSALLVPPAR